MPRGTQLSDIEKQRIIDLKSCGKSQRQIASMINRSQSVVKNFLKLGIENYGKIKRSGRPTRFSSTVKRAVLREISKTETSSSKIVSRFNLKYDSSLVRKWVAHSGRFKYHKCLRKPALKKRHIDARLKFAEKFIKKRNMWKHVIWSDEKKFNLDGLDGFNYYWHDLRKERRVMSRTAQGGGSVMIWAAFKKNCKKNDKTIFQQDNAPIHTASSTKKWFQEFGIELLPWPALSPDLNPIENLWGILARKVYDQKKPPIESIAELKKRIQSSWADIPNEILNKLFDTVHDRLLDLKLQF
ncbi:hypothetical protein KPH14_012181 [Odynerus spinipes]|uniref:Tc1-like transposase DDE domain-containing protein n=1 Tax=Odynerus spinipes TaxID=1348599 RepID=A0AAD9RIB2_9HYME|nr:hypothetical protein KPH14_012181 [Odynerus spinipes]